MPSIYTEHEAHTRRSKREQWKREERMETIMKTMDE